MGTIQKARPTPRRRSKHGETPEERLAAVAEAAHRRFSRFGYRQTQMADIAKAAGVSAAALYTYAENKDALLYLAYLSATDRPMPDEPLPIRARPRGTIAEMGAKDVERIAKWPRLRAAAEGPDVPSLVQLVEVGEEIYDMQAKNRRAIWLLDRMSVDMEDMGELHAARGHGMFQRLLMAVIAKAPAPGIVPDVAARDVIELMAWPSMHRHRDAWLTSEGPEDAIRATATRQFAGALAAVMVGVK